MTTITLRPRPLTPEETHAGWGAVLVADVPSWRPIYLAHGDDVTTFATSPMGTLLARTTGARIVVDMDATTSA